MTAAVAGLVGAAGLAGAGAGAWAVELAFVLLLGGCAAGALTLLGVWNRKDRRPGES